jgi:hypothetical protein
MEDMAKWEPLLVQPQVHAAEYENTICGGKNDLPQSNYRDAM